MLAGVMPDIDTLARSRLCLALDTEDLGEAVRWSRASAEYVGWVKVGLQLFAAYGPRSIREVSSSEQQVFLDLKFHDIPTTVAGAVSEIAALGVGIINVHASGGEAMITSAVQAAADTARKFGLPRPPDIVAVTLLTSLDARELLEVLGVDRDPTQHALELARVAKRAGASGVIASPWETPAIKRELGSDFKVITPGIRMLGEAANDQKRVADPAGAIALGSDLLVLGRSITLGNISDRAAQVHAAVAQQLSNLPSE